MGSDNIEETALKVIHIRFIALYGDKTLCGEECGRDDMAWPAAVDLLKTGRADDLCPACWDILDGA